MAASRMVQDKVPGDIPDRTNEIIEAPGLTVSDVTRIAQDRRIPPALLQPMRKRWPRLPKSIVGD